MKIFFFRILIALAFTVITCECSMGCMSIGPEGLIGVKHEDVVIIWDKANRREHFIRSVELNSSATNAGFLVPTPTAPDLSVADERIFALPYEYLPQTTGARADSMPVTRGLSESKEMPHVILQTNIGDYHAAVLEASDLKGLESWLKSNGYPWQDSTAEWVAPYLDAKWKITAFKLQGAGQGTLGTKAIRMSFHTDKPFFPYREPAEAGKLSGDHRELRIAFLSDVQVVGTLGDGSAWPGKLKFSGPTMQDGIDQTLWFKYARLNGQPAFNLPKRLTWFSDTSNPRPGKTDLFFSPLRNP